MPVPAAQVGIGESAPRSSVSAVEALVEAGAAERLGHRATAEATRATGAAGATGSARAAAVLARAAVLAGAAAGTGTVTAGGVRRGPQAGAGAGTGVGVVQAEREGDAFARDVHVEHLHADDVAGLDHVAGVLDEGLRHGRDVYQAVLVHAHVDEGAERGDVGDHAFEQHAGAQVGEGLHAVGEGRGLERRARVPARLLQLLEDVGDGRQAERVVDELGRLDPAQDRTV